MVNRVIQNQASAASRKNPINEELAEILQSVGDATDVFFEIFSGSQTGEGASRPHGAGPAHDHGQAADLKIFVMEDGKKRFLNMTDEADQPLLTKVVSLGRDLGLNGLGAGPDYMGPESFHLDVYGDNYRTWGTAQNKAGQWTTGDAFGPLEAAFAKGVRLPPLDLLDDAKAPIPAPRSMIEDIRAGRPVTSDYVGSGASFDEVRGFGAPLPRRRAPIPAIKSFELEMARQAERGGEPTGLAQQFAIDALTDKPPLPPNADSVGLFPARDQFDAFRLGGKPGGHLGPWSMDPMQRPPAHLPPGLRPPEGGAWGLDGPVSGITDIGPGATRHDLLRFTPGAVDDELERRKAQLADYYRSLGVPTTTAPGTGVTQDQLKAIREVRPNTPIPIPDPMVADLPRVTDIGPGTSLGELRAFTPPRTTAPGTGLSQEALQAIRAVPTLPASAPRLAAPGAGLTAAQRFAMADDGRSDNGAPTPAVRPRAFPMRLDPGNTLEEVIPRTDAERLWESEWGDVTHDGIGNPPTFETLQRVMAPKSPVPRAIEPAAVPEWITVTRQVPNPARSIIKPVPLEQTIRVENGIPVGIAPRISAPPPSIPETITITERVRNPAFRAPVPAVRRPLVAPIPAMQSEALLKQRLLRPPTVASTTPLQRIASEQTGGNGVGGTTRSMEQSDRWRTGY